LPKPAKAFYQAVEDKAEQSYARQPIVRRKHGVK
jgi:hypothetical protein